MQRRFGGAGRPVLQPNPVNDYGTGFMGAYGVALALLYRQRTGQGSMWTRPWLHGDELAIAVHAAL